MKRSYWVFLAILWSLALIADIISAAKGESPSWILVFCPLVTLIVFLCLWALGTFSD